MYVYVLPIMGSMNFINWSSGLSGSAILILKFYGEVEELIIVNQALFSQ